MVTDSFRRRFNLFVSFHFTLVEINVIDNFLKKNSLSMDQEELDTILCEKEYAEALLNKVFETSFVGVA